eukprot:2491887-Rhodomonas_salina.2
MEKHKLDSSASTDRPQVLRCYFPYCLAVFAAMLALRRRPGLTSNTLSATGDWTTFVVPGFQSQYKPRVGSHMSIP